MGRPRGNGPGEGLGRQAGRPGHHTGTPGRFQTARHHHPSRYGPPPGHPGGAHGSKTGRPEVRRHEQAARQTGTEPGGTAPTASQADTRAAGGRRRLPKLRDDRPGDPGDGGGPAIDDDAVTAVPAAQLQDGPLPGQLGAGKVDVEGLAVYHDIAGYLQVLAAQGIVLRAPAPL